MKYAVELGSGVMTYMPSFIKTGSGIQKLMGGHTDTQKAWRFFRNEESTLKVMIKKQENVLN
jgi:hypothetical protein